MHFNRQVSVRKALMRAELLEAPNTSCTPPSGTQLKYRVQSQEKRVTQGRDMGACCYDFQTILTGGSKK